MNERYTVFNKIGRMLLGCLPRQIHYQIFSVLGMNFAIDIKKKEPYYSLTSVQNLPFATFSTSPTKQKTPYTKKYPIENYIRPPVAIFAASFPSLGVGHIQNH